MQSRIEALQRLVNLYSALEEMHSAELKRATNSALEAQRSIKAEHETAALLRRNGHAALRAGDRISWMMAETQQEVSLYRRNRLEKLRLEREDLQNTAVEQYVASRLKREQMERVLDDIADNIELEQERHSQAASDDRFLARRRWTDARDNRSVAGGEDSLIIWS